MPDGCFEVKPAAGDRSWSPLLAVSVPLLLIFFICQMVDDEKVQTKKKDC